jgi:hypothetical protein
MAYVNVFVVANQAGALADGAILPAGRTIRTGSGEQQ